MYHFEDFRDWLTADFNEFIMMASYSTCVDRNPLSECVTCELFYHDTDSPR